MAALNGNAAGGSSSGSANRTVTITPSVGDLIVVFACLAVNTNLAPTCSDAGSTYTRICTARKAASADTMSCFVRDALAPTTTALTATVASGSNDSGVTHAVRVSGMSRIGGTAVRQFAVQENQAAATPAPAFAIAALTGNLCLGAAGNASAAQILSPPASWTEQQDSSFTTPAVAMESAGIASGFTGTTVTWGSASATAFGAIILELDTTPKEPYFPWGQRAPILAQ